MPPNKSLNRSLRPGYLVVGQTVDNATDIVQFLPLPMHASIDDIQFAYYVLGIHAHFRKQNRIKAVLYLIFAGLKSASQNINLTCIIIDFCNDFMGYVSY